MDDPAVEIEAGHLGQLDPDVLGTSHDVADRRRDLARREHPGRHLVQERLEEVVVATVDEGDVDGLAAEAPDREEAAEAAADDHHPWRGRSRPRARRYRPGLECMMPPSAKTVVAVR